MNGRHVLGRRAATGADQGSVLPLILGFWLVAMLFMAGAVALGSAFTHQRALQSTCDSAALAAANGVSPDVLHDGRAVSGALPLTAAESAVRAFLDRDPDRADVQVDAPTLSADARTLGIVCHAHTHVAFGMLIGHSGGVDQTARSAARTPVD